MSYICIVSSTTAQQKYDEDDTTTSNPSLSHPETCEDNNDDNDVDTGTVRECQVCFDEKHSDFFPLLSRLPSRSFPSPSTASSSSNSYCRCLADACLACLQQHLRTQITAKEWRREGALTCPVCNRGLRHDEVEEYADGETLAM